MAHKMNSEEGVPGYLTCAIIVAIVVVSVLASLVFGPIAGFFVIVVSVIIALPSKPKK